MGLLRFYLAASVAVGHTGIFYPNSTISMLNGPAAVQLFFLISGFYIGLVLNTKYHSLSDFYFNRFLRLFPTYWFVIVVSIVVPSLFGIQNFIVKILYAPSLTFGSEFLLIFSSIFIFGSDIIMFFYQASDGMHFTPDFRSLPVGQLWIFHPIPPAWSLPLEIYFYILAPLLVKSVRALIVVIVISTVLRCLFYMFLYKNDPWSYRFFPFEIGIFAAGSLAYKWRHPLKKVGRLAAPLSTLFLTAYSFKLFGDISILKNGCLIACYFVSLPYLFELTRDNRVDRFIGELSFPFYIVHFPLFAILSYLVPDLAFPEFTATFVSAIFAALIQIYVHDPIEAKFKRKITI